MGEATVMMERTGHEATTLVEIRIKADPARLTLLRMVAETVGLSVDLTVDEASDVRLAVDESASLFIEHVVPGAMLTVRFSCHRNEFEVWVCAPLVSPVLPDPDGFSWQILQRLTSWIEAGQEPYDLGQSGFPSTIRFGRAL